jgi:thioredoxin-like negative regulator of GroEL
LAKEECHVWIALALAVLSLPGAPGAPPQTSRLAEARALLSANRAEDAVRAFAAANRDAAGRCAECLVGEADARLALGDYGGARKAATRAAKLPDCAPALRAQAQVIVGFSLFRGSGGDEAGLRSAAEAFKAALEISPDDLTARVNLGLLLLKLSRDEEGVAQLRAFLERAPDAAGAERVRQLIANPRRARLRFAPEFSVRTLQGEELTLASLRGRTVVLDFWGSWCRPCESVPELKQLVRRYGERLTVLSVSVHDPEAGWKSFVSSHGMTWPQYRDPDGTLAQRFGVNAFPTYLVLDGEGAIVEAITGFDDQRSVASRLGRSLEGLLGRPR